MNKPSKVDKTQFSPLANTNIDQLVAYLANLSDEAQAELASTEEGSGQSTLQGWQLATGIELLCWKGTLTQSMTFQRTAEPHQPVWSILLTDSTKLLASTEQQAAQKIQRRGAMMYLYNHHLSLDVVLEGPGEIQIILIRLKPEAWQHLLQKPPQHVAAFISDNQPRFHGFDLHASCDEYFQQLIQNSFNKHSPWPQLQATLGICNHVFAQLGQRAPSTAVSSLRPRDSLRIHKARQLLLSDFQNPLSLTQIGSMVGLGRDKLRQLFQQVYGATPHRYYQQQRMHEARRLIIEEDLSVMDAGNQVGYSHLGHFAQEFKKQFGCLPKDCKKA